MKHIMGNTPKCSECKFYQEREAGDNFRYDGWCVEPWSLAHNLLGQKLKVPVERRGVMWNWNCSRWIDAESDLTRYEVETGQPEPGRRECEQELVRSIIARAKEQQAKERREYNERLSEQSGRD